MIESLNPLFHSQNSLIKALKTNSIPHNVLSYGILFQLENISYFLLDTKKISISERKKITDFMVDEFSWHHSKNPYENDSEAFIHRFFGSHFTTRYFKRMIDEFFLYTSEKTFFEKRIRSYSDLHYILYRDSDCLEKSYLIDSDLIKFFKLFKEFSTLDDYEKTLIENIIITLEQFQVFDSLFLLKSYTKIAELEVAPLFTEPDSFKKIYSDLDHVSHFLFKNLKFENIVFNNWKNRFELIGVCPLDTKAENIAIAWENLIADKKDFYIIANTHFSLAELVEEDKNDN